MYHEKWSHSLCSTDMCHARNATLLCCAGMPWWCLKRSVGSVLRWFDVRRYDGSCIFAGRLFLLLLINEHEAFERLPLFRSYLSNWRSTSLCLFASFSMDAIVLHYYVYCSIVSYRTLLYSFIAILYRLLD